MINKLKTYALGIIILGCLFKIYKLKPEENYDTSLDNDDANSMEE